MSMGNPSPQVETRGFVYPSLPKQPAPLDTLRVAYVAQRFFAALRMTAYLSEAAGFIPQREE